MEIRTVTTLRSVDIPQYLSIKKPAEDWRPPVTEQQRIPTNETGENEQHTNSEAGWASNHHWDVIATYEYSCGKTEDDKGWW